MNSLHFVSKYPYFDAKKEQDAKLKILNTSTK